MIRLPYGISNFVKVATEGYHYVDRTPFVAQIEAMNEPYLFFLRPRRFGKSLFISLLHCYYGVEYQAEFHSIFGAYRIGQQPTSLANQYLVLKLDFSHINTQTRESTFTGFLENVRQGIGNFLAAYEQYYTDADREYIFAVAEPTTVVGRLFELTQNYLTNGKLARECYAFDELCQKHLTRVYPRPAIVKTLSLSFNWRFNCLKVSKVAHSCAGNELLLPSALV